MPKWEKPRGDLWDSDQYLSDIICEAQRDRELVPVDTSVKTQLGQGQQVLNTHPFGYSK